MIKTLSNECYNFAMTMFHMSRDKMKAMRRHWDKWLRALGTKIFENAFESPQELGTSPDSLSENCPKSYEVTIVIVIIAGFLKQSGDNQF